VIYLFADRVYGDPFTRTAAAAAAEHGTPITLVVSRKATSGRGRPESFLGRIRRRVSEGRRRSRLAREVGLPVLSAENVNAESFAARIDRRDHGIVAGFNQIFKAKLIARFGSLVNFHPSLLPLYRGPVPSHWCIENGEAASGFSLHRLTERIDAGEVMWQEIVPIESGDTPLDLTLRIARAAQPVFGRYLESLRTQTELPVRLVRAESVYRVHVDYRSFPEHERL